MNLELAGKVALVVGGSGSIGQAVRTALADEGAIVFNADLAPPSDAAAQSNYLPIDVTDEQSVTVAVQRALAMHCRIDALVALQGVYQAGSVAEISDADWDRMLAINLKGTFLVCRAVLPHMQARGWGRIVLVASLAGQVGGLVAGAHYAASKAGVLSLVKSLARQAGRPDITVNAVSPGPVEGGMTADWPPEDRQRVSAAIPAGRFAQPREFADLVTFLCSPRAAYIHGARLDINGGAFMA